jgi:hypothetical protein
LRELIVLTKSVNGMALLRFAFCELSAAVGLRFVDADGRLLRASIAVEEVVEGGTEGGSRRC